MLLGGERRSGGEKRGVSCRREAPRPRDAGAGASSRRESSRGELAPGRADVETARGKGRRSRGSGLPSYCTH